MHLTDSIAISSKTRGGKGQVVKSGQEWSWAAEPQRRVRQSDCRAAVSSSMPSAKIAIVVLAACLLHAVAPGDGDGSCSRDDSQPEQYTGEDEDRDEWSGWFDVDDGLRDDFDYVSDAHSDVAEEDDTSNSSPLDGDGDQRESAPSSAAAGDDGDTETAARHERAQGSGADGGSSNRPAQPRGRHYKRGAWAASICTCCDHYATPSPPRVLCTCGDGDLCTRALAPSLRLMGAGKGPPSRLPRLMGAGKVSNSRLAPALIIVRPPPPHRSSS